MYSPHWEYDIQRIFSSRLGQFNAIPARELRLYYELNASTSFHVHVGNGIEANSGFSFDTVRNIAMILLVYEPEVDKLLDGQRFNPLHINISHPVRTIRNSFDHQFRTLISLVEIASMYIINP